MRSLCSTAGTARQCLDEPRILRAQRRDLLVDRLEIWPFFLLCRQRLSFSHFLSRVSTLTRDIDIAILSVRPSVCLLRSGIR